MDLENRYSCVKIDKYIIMPTHIHVIFILENEFVEANQPTAGASPRPTLIDLIRVFKSLSTRLCNQADNIEGRKIWQTSYFDEIIRNEQAYKQIWQYIDTNPIKWREDRYYNSVK